MPLNWGRPRDPAESADSAVVRLGSPRPAAVGTVPADDRHPPARPQGPPGALAPRRRLASLLLAPVHQLDRPGYRRRLVAGGDQLLRAQVVLDVADQDRIELVVGRQAVGGLSPARE